MSVPFFAKALISKDYPEQPEKIAAIQSGGEIGPIFNCNSNGTGYRVYLVPNGGQWTKSSETQNNISLQVVENEGQGNSEKIVWGPKAQADYKLDTWEINVSKDGTSTLLIKKSKNEEGFKTAFCLGNNTVLPVEQGSNAGVTFLRVEGGERKTGAEFKLGGCRVNGGNKTEENCDIEFNQGSLFKWNGFKPKTTFPVNKEV